jgi:hypothetical protein
MNKGKGVASRRLNREEKPQPLLRDGGDFVPTDRDFVFKLKCGQHRSGSLRPLKRPPAEIVKVDSSFQLGMPIEV